MRSLAGSFDNVRGRFGAMADDRDRVASIFGTSVVADAYGSFATGWSHKRDELNQSLEGAAKALREAADQYDQVENDLAAAARGEKGTS
jgi:uncharacterized protein YukE